MYKKPKRSMAFLAISLLSLTAVGATALVVNQKKISALHSQTYESCAKVYFGNTIGQNNSTDFYHVDTGVSATISDTTRAYQYPKTNGASYPMKLGTSSSNGTFKLNFSKTLTIARITVFAATYGIDANGQFTVKDDDNELNATSTLKVGTNGVSSLTAQQLELYSGNNYAFTLYGSRNTFDTDSLTITSTGRMYVFQISIKLIQSGSGDSSESSEQGETLDPISFHFLELGNGYNGDCVYVKAGSNDILIDAGSRSDSATTIKSYLSRYVTDGKLEYVIATHAHQDHIAAMAGYSRSGVLYAYSVGTIIDFPLTESTTATYSNYQAARTSLINAGTKHYTALQCVNETGGASKVYSLGNGLSMEFLYQQYYEISASGNENNYSVVVQFSQGNKKMLFTGDLEVDGCTSLLQENQLEPVDLFKGGHHGSMNANPDSLLSVIRPATIVTCCVAGSCEYTTNQSHTMPYQETINTWAKYTDDVYITTQSTYTGVYQDIGNYSSLNGNVVVSYDANGTKTVTGSASNAKLKNSSWLSSQRTIPSQWR